MFNLRVEINKGDMDKLLIGVPLQIKNEIAPRIVKRLVRGAWVSARRYAARAKFEGTIRDNLVTTVLKDRGWLTVRGGSRILNEALLNEYGPGVGGFTSGKRYKSQVSAKLQKWMTKFIPNARNITLGKPGITRWGTERNKFLEPAFRKAIDRIPLILSKEIKRLK